jgi:hypothetical protein
MSSNGITLPTQKAMLAGNPRDSAIASMTNASQSQASANKLAGGRRRKYRGGAIAAPQMQMLYTPQGGPGTNPNDQMKTNASTQAQTNANRVYDKDAMMTGGSRRKRRGGNPDWLWGCMSGGKFMSSGKCTKRRRNKTHKKTRKYRKYRK